jgi:GNAT superfamily N-acetyltransferase
MHAPDTSTYLIHDFNDDLAPAFRDINAEWINTMYRMEAVDQDVLDHPRERIIHAGGIILFIEIPGKGIVGTGALKKTGDHQYELTKMGVLPSARGLKAGERLLAALIEKALTLGANPLYLLSNTKSEAGVYLYEKLGFAHDPEIMQRFGTGYERCNVAMRYRGPASIGSQ